MQVLPFTNQHKRILTRISPLSEDFVDMQCIYMLPRSEGGCTGQCFGFEFLSLPLNWIFRGTDSDDGAGTGDAGSQTIW